MNKRLLVSIIVVALFVPVTFNREQARAAEALCSAEWYKMVEKKVISGDGQGHGPDIGSEEWQSVIEFKLGIRGNPQVPKRGSEAWCRYIDQIVKGKVKNSSPTEGSPQAVATKGPSFACDKVRPGSMEAMICGDEGLSSLDRKLADVYQAASGKASDGLSRLKSEQRGWIKGRDECWKKEDKAACLREEYVRRIAALQAWYRLVPAEGPVYYQCDGTPANEVVVTFFQTEPKTLIAERGDSVSLMYAQPGGDGTKYQGRNEMLWEHQGETVVQWGYGKPEMLCKSKP